jgi:hypothetical protein
MYQPTRGEKKKKKNPQCKNLERNYIKIPFMGSFWLKKKEKISFNLQPFYLFSYFPQNFTTSAKFHTWKKKRKKRKKKKEKRKCSS